MRRPDGGGSRDRDGRDLLSRAQATRTGGPDHRLLGRWRPVLSALSGMRPRLGDTKLVTIDGPAGAGKTSAAEELANAWAGGNGGASPPGTPHEVTVIHMDDLYDGWTGLNPGLFTRIRDQILSPLRLGGAIGYDIYDWHRGTFERVGVARPTELMILEGVGAGHPDLGEFSTLRLWISIDPMVGLARARKRDHDAAERDHETAENVRTGRSDADPWDVWNINQRRYFRESKPMDHADLCADGSSHPLVWTSQHDATAP